MRCENFEVISEDTYLPRAEWMREARCRKTGVYMGAPVSMNVMFDDNCPLRNGGNNDKREK